MSRSSVNSSEIEDIGSQENTFEISNEDGETMLGKRASGRNRRERIGISGSVSAR